MTDTPLDKAWEEALCIQQAATVDKGLRPAAVAALKQFVKTARAHDAVDAWRFDDFCSSVLRSAAGEHAYPLFREILFPALQARLAEGDPEAALWLAMFSQTLYAQPDLRAAIDDPSELALLLPAAEQGRPVARRRVILILAALLHGTIHEVPAGVLAFGGSKGATAEECLEILEWLDRLMNFARAEGVTEAFSGLERECRKHAHAYREYRTDRRGASSYAAFLEREHRHDAR